MPSSQDNAADAPYDLSRTPWPDDEPDRVHRPQPVPAKPKTPLESVPTGFLPPSEVLGRYVVLYRLGTGGMGVVYAAYDPQLDRKVALKLLRKISTDTKKRKRAQQRLLEEARSMARLSHPNVITVHDVAAVEGRVIVAMEFVDGQTLSAALLKGNMHWREVVRTMREAGKGLVAAHEAGIVHRDFKPDNIMLAKDGRVLVMDFGLARALSPDLSSGGSSARMSKRELEAAHRENQGARELPREAALKLKTRVVGTPAYMAPEQHRGRHVDGRTDQFSFCVTLWEALYGHRPFQGESSKELLKQAMARDLPDAPPQSKVPSWLRAVMVKGLSPEPDDRFVSMRALLDALVHDQGGNSRRYIAAGSLVAAVGLGGLGLYYAMDNEVDPPCENGSERLRGVWDDERRTSVESAFLRSNKPYAKASWEAVRSALDDYAASWANLHKDACEATRVRGEQSDELLDLRMDCLSRRLGELDALADVFVDADAATVQQGVGATGKLIPLSVCSDTGLLKTPLSPPDDPQIRVRIDEVRDQLARAKAHEDAGRYSRGLAIAKGAVERAEGLAYQPLLAEALVQVGRLQLRVGMPDSGHETLKRAVHAAALGHHDVILASAWLSIVDVLAAGTVRLELAIELLDAAKAAIERVGQPAHLRARYHNARAVILMNKGDFAAAEAAFTEALAAHREKATDDDLFAAGLLNNLSAAQFMQDHPAEALVSLQEALAIHEHALGGQHPTVALMLVNLGAMHLELGEFETAEKALDRSIAVFEAAEGAGESRLSRALHNLAMIYLIRGEAEKSRKALRESLEIFERQQGEHPDKARTLYRLAAVEHELGRSDEARRFLRRADALARKLLGDDHFDVAVIQAEVAAIDLAEGNSAEAARKLDEALPTIEKQPTARTELAWARWRLARAVAQTDPERARKLAERARDGFDSLPGRHPWQAKADAIETWMQDTLGGSLGPRP